jgi:hypothetical protein
MALYAIDSRSCKVPVYVPNIYVNWFIRGKFDRLELRLKYMKLLDSAINAGCRF